MELVSENSSQLKAINYFHKKAPLQMLDGVLNAHEIKQLFNPKVYSELCQASKVEHFATKIISFHLKGSILNV